MINLQHRKFRNILCKFYSARIANCYWLFVAFPPDYKCNLDVLQKYIYVNDKKFKKKINRNLLY